MIKDCSMEKVCTNEVQISLNRLKPIIEFIYSMYIFPLNFWQGDLLYYKTEYNKNDNDINNQANITNEITNKFKEIYALIMCGLGQSI